MQAISRLSVLATEAASGIGAVLSRVRRVALFSPADDLVYPQKNVTAALDRGSVTVASGSRLLSRISVNGVREYLFDESRYPQPEELASSLLLAMNELGASRSDVTLTIPKAWAVMKTVEFPVTVREDLSNVIRYELDRITPFSSDEAYYDFRVLGEQNGRLVILVVAARSDVALPYITALSEKGIGVSRLVVDTHALLFFSRRLAAGRDSLFLKIDRLGYEGALISKDMLVSAYSGGFAAADELARVGQIASELKSLSGTAGLKSPEAIILLREGSPSFKELLKSHLPLAARFLGELDLRVRISAPETALPYAAVAGLYQSMLPDHLQMNLLRKGITPRSKTPFVLTMVLLACILAAGALYVVAPLRIEEARLRAIAGQIAAKKEEVRKIEALQKNVGALQAEIDTISGFKPPEPVTLNILKEITTVLPKTAWISRAKITQAGVDLEGYAASANELLPKLEASRYFRKVEFAQPTFRDVRMNSDRFVIRLEVEGATKTEPAPPLPPKGAPAKNEKK